MGSSQMFKFGGRIFTHCLGSRLSRFLALRVFVCFHCGYKKNLEKPPGWKALGHVAPPSSWRLT